MPYAAHHPSAAVLSLWHVSRVHHVSRLRNTVVETHDTVQRATFLLKLWKQCHPHSHPQHQVRWHLALRFQLFAMQSFLGVQKLTNGTSRPRQQGSKRYGLQERMHARLQRNSSNRCKNCIAHERSCNGGVHVICISDVQPSITFPRHKKHGWRQPAVHSRMQRHFENAEQHAKPACQVYNEQITHDNFFW